MQKFNKLKSIPAYLPIVNIDTDMIIPKQFLKTIKRTGLGKNLFFEMRYDDQGKEINDFVLNKDPFNQSKILIAGKNFGCGSSREHAPWALLDFGITCVISSSYADIFFSNCFKNGILPIILEEEKIKELSEYANRQEEISIDLQEEKIVYGNNELKFEVDPFKKKCLLEGLDDIALSLKKSEKIFQVTGAGAILMNIHNGEILSLTSIPDYDLNKRQNLSQQIYINRITKGVYELGSVFKSFTLAAALNLNLLKPDEIFYNLEKKMKCGNRIISEYDEELPKNLSVEQILIKSGNIGSVKIGQIIGKDNLKNFLKKN